LQPGEEFFNFYNHDFVRVAVAVPLVQVSNPEFNADQTIELIGQAAELKAALVLFPELGLSAYSCEDLFHQKALLNSALAALERVREASRKLRNFRTVTFPVEMSKSGRLLPSRTYERFPYIPSDPAHREERCREVYQIQVQGLAKRLQSTGSQRVVIGISGGLDSTHALLVCAQCMDLLGYPRTNILSYTMP
jgi:NAD+ synthase (glutamine-hydrolysing)